MPLSPGGSMTFVARMSRAVQRFGDEPSRAIGAPLMEGMAPAPGIAMCHIGGCQQNPRRGPSLKEITTIGLDLAKNLFPVHAVDATGAVVIRRQVRRAQRLPFFSRLAPCLIGVEARAGAHYWARELTKFGHEVRLIPPSYVTPFVKRARPMVRRTVAAVRPRSPSICAAPPRRMRRRGGCTRCRALARSWPASWPPRCPTCRPGARHAISRPGWV